MVKRLISVLYLVSRIFMVWAIMRQLKKNYALFDYLEYVPYDYSMKPIYRRSTFLPKPEGNNSEVGL